MVSSVGSSGVLKSLNRTQEQLQRSFEKLSSGKRINRASDDAAGLAIANALATDAVVLRQGTRNAADAQSALEISDSALSQISDINSRLQELAVQASNGTLSDEQRSALNTEYQELSQEIQRIGETTEFNGIKLLNGSEVSVQVGTDSSSGSQISTEGADISSLAQSVTAQALNSVEGARAAIDALSKFASSVNSSRGDIGATSARLQSASNSNEEQRINSIEAESRIRDADVAQSVAENVTLKIQQRQAAALGAQINIQSSRVLDLLK